MGRSRPSAPALSAAVVAAANNPLRSPVLVPLVPPRQPSVVGTGCKRLASICGLARECAKQLDEHAGP